MKKEIMAIQSRLDRLRGRKDTGARVEQLLLKDRLKSELKTRAFLINTYPSLEEVL
jgi:hypothetical protein